MGLCGVEEGVIVDLRVSYLYKFFCLLLEMSIVEFFQDLCYYYIGRVLVMEVSLCCFVVWFMYSNI